MDDLRPVRPADGADDDIPAGVRAAPRNPWLRAQAALERLDRGDPRGAERMLDTIRYHPKVPAEVFAAYAAAIARARRLRGPAAGPFDTPADYLSSRDPRLRRPFRQLHADARPPSPYPAGLALPPHVGAANRPLFLEDAASRLSEAMLPRIGRVHAVVAGDGGAGTARLLGALAAQEGVGPALAATVFDPRPGPAPSFPAGIAGDVVAAAPVDPAAAPRLREIAATADLVVFLSGKVVLDPQALRRALHYAAVSDAVVQPLLEQKPGDDLTTPFARLPAKRLSRFPFRDVRGLNMVVPAALLRRAGLPDTRFRGLHFAARELAFRLVRAGAYLVPLTVPRVEAGGGAREDAVLYRALCPNHWDRKGPKAGAAPGGAHVPRVSIYVPAHDAAAHIERAVDSVLEQDFADLEVCIADDGSGDGTADLLHRLYEGEPRVRWETFRNGGIGFASNRAIRMSRAPYVGQLDSDDRLKPGAVARLVAALDEDPQLTCAYGSCERIDAEDDYVKDEYAWPVYSREKLMITSIVHHFRMFRRAAWERTSLFREDIANAVDYDVFLKLAEVGPMRHVEEILYQRRWHGRNTSSVNEGLQTANTHRVQREALTRMGLERFWDVHVPDPEQPRRVTYRRRPDMPMVLFWPDYSRSNPYQHLLYGRAREAAEVAVGDIDAALRQIDGMERPELLTFHLHWLNFVLLGVAGQAEARARIDAFLGKVETFVARGGRLVWTIHNIVSHDSPFHALEVEMSNRIAAAAHVLHFHCAASVEEVAGVFDIPREKVRVSRHGSYVGAYPDFVTRAQARAQLGLGDDEDVILFSGQVRPYKGVEQLVAVFRDLLAERPRATLLIVGRMTDAVWSQVSAGLGEAERARVRATHRFVSDPEIQLFFRAADMAVYPYQKILTSGSLMLALSFGTPVVIPAVGMTREVLYGRGAGLLYDADAGVEGLREAVRAMLRAKDEERLAEMSRNARAVAEGLSWPDFTPTVVRPA